MPGPKKAKKAALGWPSTIRSPKSAFSACLKSLQLHQQLHLKENAIQQKELLLVS